MDQSDVLSLTTSHLLVQVTPDHHYFPEQFCAFSIYVSPSMRLNISPVSVIRSLNSHFVSQTPIRSMASSTPITISDITYIPPTRLAFFLRSSPPKPASIASDPIPPSIAVIDVRDSDHVGGHIVSSTWIPSDQLPTKLPELVRTLADKDMVVFHCSLSQQRGPSAALKYARERQRLLGKDKGNQEQKVCVLEGGFTAWQASYGEDESLTEGYVKDLWQD